MEKCIPFLSKRMNDKLREMFDCGYAHGYVAVPKTHPWFGKSYVGEIENQIEVHGGITFSGKFPISNDLIMIEEGDKLPEDNWVFGFDTAHYGDNLDNCSEVFCISETLKLKEQLEKIK